MPVARAAVERERGLRREPTLEQLAGLTGQRLEGALGVLAAGNAVLVGVILDLVVQRAGLDLRDQLGGLGLPPQLGRRLLLRGATAAASAALALAVPQAGAAEAEAAPIRECGAAPRHYAYNITTRVVR